MECHHFDYIYPLLLKIYLNLLEGSKFIEEPPLLDEITNIIEPECNYIDYDYGQNDIVFRLYKVEDSEEIKARLKDINDINGFKIKKLEFNYYANELEE